MSFHLDKINEVYSNADGSIQFIELLIVNSGEVFFGGRMITVSESGHPNLVFTFPGDAPGSFSGSKTYLIATQGYADFATLHSLPQPDVTVASPLVFTSGVQTINYASVDSLTNVTLPTDGVNSLNHSGVSGVNSPMNFAGQAGTLVLNVPPVLAIPIPDQFDGVGQALNYQLAAGTFTEANGDTVTYTATRDDDTPLPAWLSFDGQTQTFTGTPAGGDVEAIHVKVTATDPDSSATDDFFLTVISGHVVDGGAGNDTLSGTVDADRISGLGGNDTLDGGAGDDTMLGGAGDDSYFVDSTGDQVVETSGQGTDTISTSVTLPGLAANVENLTLATGAGNLNAVGNALNNVLTGNESNNTFDGAGGADTMVGGAGDDTFLIDSTIDQVVEALSGGTYLVLAAITLPALAANVENLTLTGSSNIAGIGNGLDNAITGNTGNNFLSGGAGNDTLDGGAGNDSLTGGAGNDAFLFSGLSGTDRIVDFNSGSDQIQLDGTVFTALGVGAVAANQLEVGTSGAISDTSGDNGGDGGQDYLKYATDTGQLYYDDNGTVGSGVHLIAVLASPACKAPHPAVNLRTAQDIVVV